MYASGYSPEQIETILGNIDWKEVLSDDPPRERLSMTIRTKAAPRRSIQLELEPGSVLLMTYATQQHFDHGIPKATVPLGPRISVAFRRRPRSA